MPEGQADRVVLFRLAVAADPAAEARLKEFGGRMAAVQSQIDRGAEAAGRKRADTEQKAANKRTVDILRQTDKEMREQERASQRVEREEVRARETVARKAQQSHDAIRRSQNQMRESGYRVMEGVTKLGEGFARLGLVGEESMQKMVSGLVAVRSFFDILRGGIEVYRGLSEAARVYAGATAAAATAQAALAATGIAGVGTAAKAGLATTLFGGAAYGVGKGIGALGAAAASPVGAGALAVGGVGAAIGMGLNVAGVRDEAAKLPWMERLGSGALYATGRIAERLGVRGLNAEADWLEARKASLAGQEESDRMRRAQAAATSERLRREDSLDESLREVGRGGEARRRDAAARAAGLRPWRELGDLEGPAFEKEAAGRRMAAGVEWQTAREDAMSARAKLSGLQASGASEGHVGDLRERVLAADDRAVVNANERLRIEREIGAGRIAAAEKAAGKTQEEIQLRRDALKEEQDKLKTSIERFGQLDAQEQARLIGLSRRAKGGGQLTIEEWQSLRDVGTRQTEGMAGREFQRRAEVAGYSREFGAEERGTVERLGREIPALEVRLQGERQVKVKVERDDDRLVNRIKNEIDQVLNQRDEELARRLQVQWQQEARQRAMGAAAGASR